MSMQVRSNSSLLTEFTEQLSRHQAKSTNNSSEVGPGDFGSFLAGGVRKVNDAQQTSQLQIQGLLSGENVDTAEVITSIQKADMAFQLLVQVRNKLMKAYEEIQSINV